MQAKKDVAAKAPARELRRVGGREREKNKFLADRTPIATELTRLENAEKASWAPYAVLREPVPQHHRTDSPLRSPGASPLRSPAGKIIESPFSKARGAGQAGGGEDFEDGVKVMQVSTAGVLGASPSDDSKVARGEGGAESPVTGGKWARDRERWKTEWKLDPMESRSGEPDLGLDDARMVRAPGWARANALRSLEVIAPEHDAEVLEAAVGRLQDPEGMVRVAALKAIRRLSRRGDRDVIDAVVKLVRGNTTDRVANVRKEACVTLAAIAEKGLPPSRINQATGTWRDVEAMKRDKQVRSRVKLSMNIPGNVYNLSLNYAAGHRRAHPAAG